MNEEPTQDMSKKYDTKPTLETVLERLDEFKAAMEKRFDGLDKRMVGFDVRFDRIESEVKLTHSELYGLRADFLELKGALKEHIPALR